MANYICPHCNKESNYEFLDNTYDGEEIDTFCCKCDEPITIFVDLTLTLEADKRTIDDD